MTSRTRSRIVLSVSLALLAALALPPPAAATAWRWPVDGRVLTHFRNGDDPYARGQHRGIDIAAAAGAPVAAATDGSVRFAGAIGESGLTVSVRTADGRFDTSFLHLGSIAVRAGDAMRAGDPVGTVGTSGRRSIAEPHLHFGVRAAGERHAYRDPLSLLPPPAAEPRPVAPRAVPVVVPEGVPPLAAPATIAPPAAGPVAAPAALAPPAATAPLAPPLVAPAAATAPLTRPLPAPSPARSAAGSPSGTPAAGTPGTYGVGPDAGGRSNPRYARVGEPTSIPGRRRAPNGRRAAQPGGTDLGWLAACVGLVAAAVLLARPRGPVASLGGGRRLAAAAGGGEGADSIAAWATTSPHRSTT